MNEYEKQAKDFLNKTETKFTTKFRAHKKHFENDDATRDVYKITLKRGNREFTFDFGQSITNSKQRPKIKPSAYDVLACLQSYSVGSFEDFCGDFGYDTDSRIAEKTYKAVCNEVSNLERLYTDKELELLSEIA